MPEKKKRGNPNWIKGGKSPNPKGSAVHREVLQKEIVNAVHEALHDNKHGDAKAYMRYLADEKPALFVGIVSKVLPQNIQADVTHTILDLGQAIRDAENRMLEMRKTIDHEPTKQIDNTPEAVAIETITPDKITTNK